jgi:DNA repair protein RecO (recombination protein O)
VGLVLYKKEGRDLHSVTQCDLITSFRALSEDLPRMAAGMAIIELVSNIAHEEEENTALFDLLLTALSDVNVSDGDPAAHFFRFEVLLAGILGFKPVFDQCVSCGKKVPDTDAEIRFELDRGGPLCSNCSDRHGHTMKLSGKQLHYLASLDGGGSKAGSRARVLEPASRNEIERFLEAFLRNHVSGIRTSKSERVFSKLLDQL